MNTATTMLYLIHFSQPLGTERHQASHYLGFVEGDEVQADDIHRIVKAYMLYPSHFDLLHIDLRSESCEEVLCYDLARSTRVCIFGGAAAWEIYRQVAAIFPQINYHLTGRPPAIL